MLTLNIKKKLQHFEVDIRFEVKEELVVLFGPSGSGKTTVLNCIAGLAKPDLGRIQLHNKVLFEHKTTDLPVQQRGIGYLFQDYALFPHMTVWKNIAYGMKNEDFAKQLMNELHISHLSEQYPHEISGGEKQRVALTRALATEPSLLLLDEPFSALDEETRRKSQEELIRIQQAWQIPIILVTHDREEARKLADRMLFIESGKMIEKLTFE